MLTPLISLVLSTSLCATPPAIVPAAAPPGPALAKFAPAGAHEDSLREVYETALSWEAFFEMADARRAMWIEHRDNATPHPDLVERAVAAGGPWRILAITVPGCSDSVGTLPYLAGLVDAVPLLDFRIASPDVGQPWMDAFPARDGRAATPTILLLDEDYEIRGCWTEMPASVWAFWQPALERGEARRMLDRKMAWYLADQGREALTDLIEILEAAERGEVICPGSAPALQAQERPFGTLREQAEVETEWLRLRLERVLPRLMREHGVDMWIIPSREYNEDPVFTALEGPTTFAARRRTIYVFCDRGPELGVRRMSIGGRDAAGLYEVIREPDAAVGARGRAQEPYGFHQWRLLTPLVEECDPQTIQANISYNFAFSDGLNAGEWEQMKVALGPVYRHRVVHEELLPLQYIEERLPEMLPVYREMMEWVHETIATAFSNEVITPGETRTQDVVWWMRQRVNDAGLGSWFQPSVSVQRMGGVEESDPIIQRGDVLHTDFGITALGLATDTQHMGYVLREGETDVPEGLEVALRNSNRFQDILLEEMVPGRSGNEVLEASLEGMHEEGLDGTMYTHPIGDHGHGAGPLIGLWDRQEGVQGMDMVPIRPNTWFSTELQVTTPVPEWDGQPVRSAQEEEAYLDEEGNRHWVIGRQAEYHIVH